MYVSAVLVNINDNDKVENQMSKWRYIRLRIAYAIMVIFKWAMPTDAFTQDVLDVIKIHSGRSIRENVECGYKKPL